MTAKKILIFALAAGGEGISGGDRIFIEFARRWSRKIATKIFVSEEGRKMCRRQKLSAPVEFGIRPQKSYAARILEGIRLGVTLKLHDDTIIYSASEFWMDFLPAFILKLCFPKIKWAAAWYQTAPSPLKGFSEGDIRGRDRFRALLYWLVQQPVKPLIRKFADYILVNNDEEKKQFERAAVVLGAVDTEKIKQWKARLKSLPKIYDAVFQGRFHPQKGVVELIDIWKRVLAKKPDARLVMIGDGPLMEKVREKIKTEKLEKNIRLTGYLFDGGEKYKIFFQSRVVVHPAYYDSGGMASAEAMAFGLPCVGFNLKAYEYYYPKGMEKVKKGDPEAFAEKILKLLHDKNLYKKVSQEALQMINHEWSWEFRSRQILRTMLE